MSLPIVLAFIKGLSIAWKVCLPFSSEIDGFETLIAMTRLIGAFLKKWLHN